MKTFLSRLAATAACALLACASAFALPTTYSAVCLDSTATPVAGATSFSIQVIPVVGGSTSYTIASGSITVSATAHPTATGAAVASGATTVQVLDDGHGRYLFTYDPAVSGEAMIYLIPTKASTTFFGDGAFPAFAGADSSTIATTATGVTANGTAIAALPVSIASALGAQTYVTIDAAHSSDGTSFALTKKQWDALCAAVLAGDSSTPTAPVASGTATIKYYLAGNTVGTGTLVATGTVSFDANKVQTGRAYKVQHPFPSIP